MCCGLCFKYICVCVYVCMCVYIRRIQRREEVIKEVGRKKTCNHVGDPAVIQDGLNLTNNKR